MRLSLRSLLIWLMVLALPIQAVAAAGMQHCGATHRLMQAGSTAAVALDGHDPVHEAVPHVHADADAGLDIEVSVGAPSDAGLNSTALGDDFTCSACANCCSAVALPVNPVRLAAPPVEAHAAARPATNIDSFMPGGLERPPRPVLA